MDIFIYNNNFTHKNYKIILPIKKNTHENDENSVKKLERIYVERRYVVEAYIVRIMKARRKL